MGTSISLIIWGDDEAKAAGVTRQVFDEFGRVDRLMSSWLPDSDVARINAAAGKKPVKVDEEVFQLIVRAMDMAKRTRGAFH